MMKKILIATSLLLIVSACGRFDVKDTVENPNDVYGVLAKAEAGSKDVTCTDIRQGYKNAQTLAAKKNATVPELSLPGRYLNVQKRYSC